MHIHASAQQVLELHNFSGKQHSFTTAGAIHKVHDSLHIVGKLVQDTTYLFGLYLQPTAHKRQPVKKGIYYFHSKGHPADVPYIPTLNIIAKVDSSREIGYASIPDRSTGYVRITYIDAQRVKGEYECIVYRKFHLRGDSMTINGTFDLAIKDTRPSQATAPASAKKTEYRSPVGLFDLHASLGANWQRKIVQLPKSDFGVDVDFGATIINAIYARDVDLGMTLSLHYGYASHNFRGSLSNDLHLRRHHVYGRFRPITIDVTRPTDFNRFIGMIVSGLYLDIGHSSGMYYSTDLHGNKSAAEPLPAGIFWGWGCVIKMRYERIGFSGGYGGRRYSFDLYDKERRYRARTISLGVTYSLIWNN